MTSSAPAARVPNLTKTRRLLATAATLTVFGIGLSTAESEDLGKWVTLAGLLLLLFALHRFGRTGPDEVLQLAPPKKKKKKKKQQPEEQSG